MTATIGKIMERHSMPRCSTTLVAAVLMGCAAQRETVPLRCTPNDSMRTAVPSGYNPAEAHGGSDSGKILPESREFGVTRPPIATVDNAMLAALPRASQIYDSSLVRTAFGNARFEDPTVNSSLAVETQAVEELPLHTPASGEVLDDAVQTVPIDFATALFIAAGENPQVAFTRQRINEAYAQWRRAELMWIPSLRGGMNYNKHEGTIQTVEGNIIETSRNAMFTGFGSQAVGAGSPAVPGLVINFHTRDAIFQPRIMQRLLAASRQSNRATSNDILFETAIAYNDLLEASAVESIADTTLANTKRLAEVTAEFARAGQGLLSDADRARAEYSLNQIEVRRARENIRTASVRLACVLSEDPTLMLLPQESSLVPITVAPHDCTLPGLIATGLSNRPELAESRLLTAAAVERLRSERSAPLVPSILLGLSYGGFGGGLGGDVEDFGDRMDFDAAAFWELRNLGWGERAARAEAQARVDQARWRQVQVMDQVASEVAEAYAQVESRRYEIKLAEHGIAAAQSSFARNSERIQDALGLPIEALQSIQALDRAQRQYVRSVADYNRSQFRLQRALGWAITSSSIDEKQSQKNSG